MKTSFTSYSTIFLIAAFSFFAQTASAQFPYAESFKGKTSNGLVLGGSAVLTANLSSGADPDGDGYLRLTGPVGYQTGYAYAQDAFPTDKGLSISFEFFTYKNPATSQADGISFFLFDASVPSFRAGGTGGALGYTQRVDNVTTVPGLAMGYVGIGIDEFGNFSNQNDNKKNGGVGQTPGAIVIRGPGNGSGTTDYIYQTGVKTANAPYNIGFTGFNQRYPDSTNANYRRIKIILTPGSSLGASRGYKITVILYKGGIPNPVPVTIIDNWDYPFDAPAKLKYGFAASTGGSTNYHEIRNMDIQPVVVNSLMPPSVGDDQLTIVCQNGQGMVDVTSNDQSNNAGSTINKASVDLDPQTSGVQKTFTDPGKGTYSVDTSGLVLFEAESGFSGNSSIRYVVADEYGALSPEAGIYVTVNAGTPPDLTINDPAPVCFPQTVDITNAAIVQSNTQGAAINYFANITDANAGTNAINATAISNSGTYFVSASSGGCATVKPVIVTINQPPSQADAGADQAFCRTATGNLVANNPASGAGTWTQVSGPNTAGISIPNSSNTPLTNLVAGVYTFRWTVANGVCPASTDDVQIVNRQLPTTASAGTAQSVCNASSVTLQGNTPSVGTGLWSQAGTPAATIQSPASPTTTVSGLTPGNTYTFRWTITNEGCSSTSQVTVTNYANTIANAGSDQIAASNSVLLLNANTPGSGNTGFWSLQSGPANNTVVIQNPSNPQTQVTGINEIGEYTFRWTITNNTCVNFDDMKLSVSTTLPIDLVSFSGELNNHEVHLSWATANEYNNSHFEIERSFDGIAFNKLGIVAASGHPASLNNYRYIDDLRFVSNATLYYRLKQVDIDGTIFYSKVLAFAHAKRQAEAYSWPNPFESSINISLASVKEDRVTIKLYNANGIVVYQDKREIVTGDNLIKMPDLGFLARGLYWLEIYSENVHYRQKLVKL